MMDNRITFLDVANALGLEYSEAQVALSIPPITENTLHYRSFCISELIIKRINYDAVNFKWAVINRVISGSNLNSVIVLIQFSSTIQAFPLELTHMAYSGNKDSIIANLRRIERELPEQIEAWSILTKKGMKSFRDNNDLLFKMNRMINTKQNHMSR